MLNKKPARHLEEEESLVWPVGAFFISSANTSIMSASIPGKYQHMFTLTSPGKICFSTSLHKACCRLLVVLLTFLVDKLKWTSLPTVDVSVKWGGHKNFPVT